MDGRDHLSLILHRRLDLHLFSRLDDSTDHFATKRCHTANAGLSKMHGLRHAYAQQRYLEITGWPSPHAGGPGKEALTPAQRPVDLHARLVISEELGHAREQITAVYLGR